MKLKEVQAKTRWLESQLRLEIQKRESLEKAYFRLTYFRYSIMLIFFITIFAFSIHGVMNLTLDEKFQTYLDAHNKILMNHNEVIGDLVIMNEEGCECIAIIEEQIEQEPQTNTEITIMISKVNKPPVFEVIL